MAGGCTQSHCYQDGTCLIGEPDKTKCPHYAPAPDRQVDDKNTEECHVPWNGVTAGTSDLAYLCSRGQVKIIGLVGAHDAGKTTFLALFYSILLRKTELPFGRIAGSHTLGGWESIANHMRWAADRPPSFPPHTTSYSTRQPGMLHLAIRLSHGGLRDVLFTDAPGEWFTEWATVENSPAAAGARWIAERAHSFIQFVDSARMSDVGKLGAARNEYYSLIERVASVAKERAVIMALTKSDMAISSAVRSQLENRQRMVLRDASWHETSDKDADSIYGLGIDAIQRALSVAPAGAAFDPYPSDATIDPFLTFRG